MKTTILESKFNTSKLIADNPVNINKLNNYGERFLEGIHELPYYTIDEIDNYKGLYSDKTLIKIDDEYTVQEWRDEYRLISSGIISENYNKVWSSWYSKLCKLQIQKDENIRRGVYNNEVKQYMLDLGWNPEIRFDRKEIHEVCSMMKQKLYKNTNIYDISALVEASQSSDDIELDTSINRNPIHIVLVYTGTGFSKVIKRYTKGTYTHAGVSLDSNLKHIYSYNLQNNGFDVETLSDYVKNSGKSEMAVYTLFVNDKEIKTIKNQLDKYILNRHKTKYSVFNIFGILFNKPVETNTNMICSQFIDSLLKSINIDITNKNSAIVTPNDLHIALNPKIYKMYEGNVWDYMTNNKSIPINHTIVKLYKKSINESVTLSNKEDYNNFLLNESLSIETLNTLNECNINDTIIQDINNTFKAYIDIDYLNEKKEFPVQFDNDGNLLITKISKIGFDEEYSKSHKLLKIYEDSNNIEGMKYELSKLWFMNICIEKKLYSNIQDNEKNNLHKSRARILNDFNKYLKIITSIDNTFNFYEYYDNSPFSDATIKINSSTIKHSRLLLKDLIRSGII
ncbi:MAG: hypothetical protein ACRCXT_02270 [Paraclostridium sp.]